MMSPKKARENPRYIKVPADIPTEFELGDTAADIQKRREKRKRGRKGEATGAWEGEGGTRDATEVGTGEKTEGRKK